MTRCLPPLFTPQRLAAVLLAVLCAAPLLAQAEPPEPFGSPPAPEQQALPRHFPDHADKGDMRFIDPPMVRLGGETLMISPGARIRDERNMMVHMSQLKGKGAQVMYVRDAMQQIGDIWILSPYEASQPSPKQKREDLLRMDGYDPSAHKFDPMLPYNQQPKYK